MDRSAIISVALLFGVACSSTQPGSGSEQAANSTAALAGDVTWGSVVGVATNGPSVTKIAADGWGDASATAAQFLTGDGAVQFTTEEVGTYKMAGLTHAVSNSSYTTLDYAVFLVADGSIEIFEDAVYMGTFGTYSANDVFTIQVTGGQVIYSRNGSAFYTSQKQPALPLYVDAVPYSQGATIRNVALFGSIGGGITWTDVGGVATSFSSVTKFADDGWGNASAVSVESLTGDGTVQFSTEEATTHKMAGLTHAVTDTSYDTIDYAIFLVAGGLVEIFESGVYVGVFGTYQANDVFTIQVSGTQVTYLRNGAVLTTSRKAPTLPLVFDVAPFSRGATIDDVTLAASSGGGITWAAPVGVATTPSSVIKTAADGWGDAFASSVQALAGDGTLEFTTGEASTYKMAGLTHAVTNHSYTTIDYAIFLVADGSVEIFEDAAFLGVFGKYAAGDVFTIRVAGGQVTYLRNGSVLTTSPTPPRLPLYVDAVPYSWAATIENVALTPGP